MFKRNLQQMEPEEKTDIEHLKQAQASCVELEKLIKQIIEQHVEACGHPEIVEKLSKAEEEIERALAAMEKLHKLLNPVNVSNNNNFKM